MLDELLNEEQLNLYETEEEKNLGEEDTYNDDTAIDPFLDGNGQDTSDDLGSSLTSGGISTTTEGVHLFSPTQPNQVVAAAVTPTVERENGKLKITLDTQKFGNFMNILSTLSKSCDDMVIRGGKICQKSNKRNVIFRIDARQLLGDANLTMSTISAKEKMLVPFRKQQSKMEILLDDELYIFRDQESSIEGRQALDSHLSNRFHSDEELEAMLNIDVNGKIMECEIQRYLIDRLSAFCDALSATKLLINFSDGEAKFLIKSMDNTSNVQAKLMTVRNLESGCEELDGYCAFPSDPFFTNVDNWKASFYYVVGRRNVLMILDSYMDTEKTIPISLYCLSQFRGTNELEE